MTDKIFLYFLIDYGIMFVLHPCPEWKDICGQHRRLLYYLQRKDIERCPAGAVADGLRK